MTAARRRVLGLVTAAALLTLRTDPAHASAASIRADASKALQALYAKNPSAKTVGQKAKAVLVFPNIVKAGFMFGGQIGDGALLEGQADGRLLQLGRGVVRAPGGRAGVRLRALLHERRGARLPRQDRAAGRSASGPSIVVVDEGVGKSITQHDAHAGRLRLHLRPEGPDGGHRHPGLEDHAHPSEVDAVREGIDGARHARTLDAEGRRP